MRECASTRATESDREHRRAVRVSLGTAVWAQLFALALRRRHVVNVLEQLRGRHDPVAKFVPDTQPAFAHASRELRLGRLCRPLQANNITREGCPAEARAASGGPVAPLGRTVSCVRLVGTRIRRRSGVNEQPARPTSARPRRLSAWRPAGDGARVVAWRSLPAHGWARTRSWGRLAQAGWEKSIALATPD